MKKFIFKLLFAAFSAMVITLLFAVPFALSFAGIVLAGALIGQLPKGALFETLAPDLLAELKTMREALQKDVTTKAKEDMEVEIKKLEKNIKDLESKLSAADNTELKKLLDEVKASVEEFKGWKVTKDEADKKNQEAWDKIIIEGQRAKGPDSEKKSFGAALDEAFNEGDNFKNIEMLATGHKERKKRFIIELKLVGDITTGNVTGGSRYGAIMAPGIIEIPRRKVHIRDIVPVGTLGPGNTYTFMRENGDGEGAITAVAETATKPQLDFDLVETTVNVETIAGWVRFTKKAMNNIPGFIAFLQSRLPEKLLRVEDAQLLSGNGNTPNISGITDAGNYTAATSTSDVLVEAIIDSLAQLEDDEERDATGILLRPVDYYGFFKNKASGSQEYDLPQNVSFVNGVLYISGVPVFASTAQTSGKYIVGDFRMGAQLLVQNAMRIEFFEQDADNVTKNKITARIEEDVAFPIYGDNYFIYGDVPATS